MHSAVFTLTMAPGGRHPVNHNKWQQSPSGCDTVIAGLRWEHTNSDVAAHTASIIGSPKGFAQCYRPSSFHRSSISHIASGQGQLVYAEKCWPSRCLFRMLNFKLPHQACDLLLCFLQLPLVQQHEGLKLLATKLEGALGTAQPSLFSKMLWQTVGNTHCYT